MKRDSDVQSERLGSASTQALKTTAPHILVVDDDGDIRLLNASVLKRAGYAVDTADNGARGWRLLCLNGYDLLITDNEMPELSGIDLLRRMRAADMSQPVIIATGRPPTQELAQNPQLQATTLLLKPYTIDDLLAAVRSALRCNGIRIQTASPTNLRTRLPIDHS